MLLARVGTVLCICIHTTSSSLVVCIQYDTREYAYYYDRSTMHTRSYYTYKAEQ